MGTQQPNIEEDYEIVGYVSYQSADNTPSGCYGIKYQKKDKFITTQGTVSASS